MILKLNILSVYSATQMSLCATGSKQQLTFPCLDLCKMNRKEKRQHHQKLHAESVDIIDAFQHLLSSMTRSLKQRHVSVKNLLHSLAGIEQLPRDYKHLSTPVVIRQVPDLSKTTTIDEAMLVIGNYCSFFNFHMIEHIINKLGTIQDKKTLTKYRVEFNQYAKRYVFECPFEVGTVSEGLVNMYVTLDKEVDEITLRVLQRFVENLRKVLRISSGAVFKLCRIEPGSLKLTFQLNFSALQDIFPLSSRQEADLTSLGVDSLWIIYQFHRRNVKRSTTTGEWVMLVDPYG